MTFSLFFVNKIKSIKQYQTQVTEGLLNYSNASIISIYSIYPY